MVDDGGSPLAKFMEAEEKRGFFVEPLGWLRTISCTSPNLSQQCCILFGLTALMEMKHLLKYYPTIVLALYSTNLELRWGRPTPELGGINGYAGFSSQKTLCNTFLDTKMADQLEAWHPRTLFQPCGSVPLLE